MKRDETGLLSKKSTGRDWLILTDILQTLIIRCSVYYRDFSGILKTGPGSH